MTINLGLQDRHGNDMVTRFHLGENSGRIGNGLNHCRELFEVIIIYIIRAKIFLMTNNYFILGFAQHIRLSRK